MKTRAPSLRQAGQAVAEFALIGLIFFGLMCGIVDFGRGIWNYNVLSNATREGARYGSVLHVTGTGVVGLPDCSGVRTAAAAISVGLDPAQFSVGCKFGSNNMSSGDIDTYKVAPGATLDSTVLTYPRPTNQKPQDAPYYIAVSATYNFQLITPIIASFVGGGTGRITLRSDTVMVTSF